MELQYGLRDLRRNKGVNLALATVLVLSAFLMATGAMVMERVVGSVDRLFEQAQPPHFLQMHVGDYDVEALGAFAEQRPEVRSWLIEDMIGFDSSSLAWERPSTGSSGDLSASLVDNLFVAQNEDFDFLIDQSGAIAQPARGEVYAPVAYREQFALEVGDELQVRTSSGVVGLAVRGFVRDAQMASSLSSATRFLVSEADLTALGDAGGGAPEIIVEYRLDDPSLAGDLRRAYEADDALPANGQAVTYDQIRIINAVSDGLVAVALVLGSLVLIAIALLNVRFVIRGTLEDEIRAIAVMKAIGLPDRTIRRLHLARYGVMTAVACVVGGLMAVPAAGALTRDAAVSYAAAPLRWSSVVVPLLALLVVLVVVLAICSRVLSRVRRIEVVGALVHGSTLDEGQTARRARRRTRRLRTSVFRADRGGDLNRRLALVDLRADLRQWLLLPAVFGLAAALMAIPANLLSTLTDPAFVTYMGAPQADVRADLQLTDDVDELRDDVVAAMEDDARVTGVRILAEVVHQARGDEGWESLRVQVGAGAGDGISYLEGRSPSRGEIALSVLNADAYGVGVGDDLVLQEAGHGRSVPVSGVYQDVTSGGRTAKMEGAAQDGASGYVVYADTVDDVDPVGVADDYGAQFPAAAVVPMQAYVTQTLSYVTDAFSTAALLAAVSGVGVAGLTCTLFLQLRMSRERTRTGVLSALGFSGEELAWQVRFKTLLAVTTGTAAGLVLAATLGELLVGVAISVAALGITSISFTSNPWVVHVAYPLLLVAAGLLGAVVVSDRLRRVDAAGWLRS